MKKTLLCKCANCLKFDFENCLTEDCCFVSIGDKECEAETESDTEEAEEESRIPDETLFDFLTEDSYVALFSATVSRDPFYILKIVKKLIASENTTDSNGHMIIKGEKYFVGHYL